MDIALDADAPDLLEVARSAARGYAVEVGLPADQAGQLLGPPVFGPVDIGQPGAAVVAYRWLGGGRGGPYLQVEVEVTTEVVTVFSGGDHQEGERRTYFAEEVRRRAGSG